MPCFPVITPVEYLRFLWSERVYFLLALFEQAKLYFHQLQERYPVPFSYFAEALRVAGSLLPRGLLSPKKSLEGQVILVTGAGSGIGRACALEFAKLGARLVLWDIDAGANRETRGLVDGIQKERLAEEPANRWLVMDCHDYCVDVADKRAVREAAAKVLGEVGHVDILFSNAGIVTGKRLIDCEEEEIEKTMAVNTMALFYLTKAFLPQMLARRWGQIVVMASTCGHVGVTHLVDYCTSKYAAVGFCDALRAELGSTSPIIITAISPFCIDTGMFEGAVSYAPSLLPILKLDDAVKSIVNGVRSNADEVYIPSVRVRLYLILKGLLPTRALLIATEYFGFDRSMDNFVGRGENKKRPKPDAAKKWMSRRSMESDDSRQEAAHNTEENAKENKTTSVETSPRRTSTSV